MGLCDGIEGESRVDDRGQFSLGEAITDVVDRSGSPCVVGGDLEQLEAAKGEVLEEHRTHVQRSWTALEKPIKDDDGLTGGGLDEVGQGRAADRIEDDPGPLACSQLTHPGDDVLLGGADDRLGSGLQKLLPLGAGTGQGDGTCARPASDLDRRETNTAGRGRDQHGVSGANSSDVQETAVGGDERIPHRGRLLEGQLLRMGDDGVHGSEDRLTVHRVVGHGEGRHHADGLARTEPGALVPDGRDHAGGVVADTRRKDRVDAVFALAEHRFRPVQPQRAGVDKDFTRTGNRGGDLLKPQDLGTTRLMKSDGAAHDAVFRCVVPCPEGEDASASAGVLQLASSRSVSAEAEPGSVV